MSYLGKDFTSIRSHNQNINLETGKILLSRDLKHGIIYSSDTLLCLDLNSKKVTSKIVFKLEEKISNVKVTQSNTFTFIKEKGSNTVDIVTLNFNGLLEYYELKMNYKIQDYHCTMKGGIHYTFVVNCNYDLFLFKENILTLRQNIKPNFKTFIGKEEHYKTIARIEYIQHAQLLLIITSTGEIMSYSLNDDNQNDAKEVKLIQQVDIYGNSGTIDIVFIKQSLFVCNHSQNEDSSNIDIIKEEIDEEKDKSFQYNNEGTFPSNHQCSNIFLTFVSNHDSFNTIMSFFEVKHGQLLKQNMLIIKAKTCADAYISKNCLSSLWKNDNSNVIPIYFLICLKSYNSYEFYYTDFLDCFGKKIHNNDNDNENVDYNNYSKVTLVYLNSLKGDISNIQKISFINAVISSKKTMTISSIDDENYDSSQSNSLKLNIKIIRRINEYECFITNELITEKITSPYNEEVFIGAFSTDINHYLDFYSKERNSFDNIALYRDRIFQIISDEPMLISNLKPSFDIQSADIDPYLLLLIFNNAFLSIKKYINTRDMLNYNQFLISNDILYETVRNIYESMKKSIEQAIKQRNDPHNIISQKGANYIKLLINIMKIIRHRNAHPIGQPYMLEKDIMTDEAIIIDSMLFDMDIILIMIKIYKQCNEYDIDANNNAVLMDNRKGYYINIINLKYDESNHSCCSSVDVGMNNDSGLNELFINYFNKCQSDSLRHYFLKEKAGSVNVKGMIYYMKFMFFNYYFYLVASKAIQEGILYDSKGFQLYFNTLLSKEYTEYKCFSMNLYLLDQAQLQENSNNISQFDIFSIIHFFIKINESNIIHTKIFKELFSNDHLKNFNSMFINLLISNGYINESYTLSNSLSTYYTEYDEWQSHLYILLKLKMFNLAWEVIAHFFANDYLNLQMSQIKSTVNITDEDRIQSLITSEKFNEIKSMHYNFFKYLIEYEHLDILFSLPLNFQEQYLLKIFLIESQQYEELLIVFFSRYRKVKEADACFRDYLKKATLGKEASKALYKNLIDTLMYLFGKQSDQREMMKGNELNLVRINDNALYIENDIKSERNGNNNVPMSMIHLGERNSNANKQSKHQVITTIKLVSDSNLNNNNNNSVPYLRKHEEEINGKMKNVRLHTSIIAQDALGIGKTYMSGNDIQKITITSGNMNRRNVNSQNNFS